MRQFIEGKTVLVTGGTGSIGSEIVRQLLSYDPKMVRVHPRAHGGCSHDLEGDRVHDSERAAPAYGNDQRRIRKRSETDSRPVTCGTRASIRRLTGGLVVRRAGTK